MKTLKLSLLCILFSSFSLAFASEAGPADAPAAEQSPVAKVKTALDTLQADQAKSIQEQLAACQTIQANFKEGVAGEDLTVLAALVGRPARSRMLVLDGVSSKVDELKTAYVAELNGILSAAVAAIVNPAEGADLSGNYQTVKTNIRALTQEQINALGAKFGCRNLRPAVEAKLVALLAPVAPIPAPAPASAEVVQLTTHITGLSDSTLNGKAEKLEAYLFIRDNLRLVTGDNLGILKRHLCVVSNAQVVINGKLNVKIAELEAQIEAAAAPALKDADHAELELATESLYAVKERLASVVATLKADKTGLTQELAAQGGVLAEKTKSVVQERTEKERFAALAKQNQTLATAALEALKALGSDFGSFAGGAEQDGSDGEAGPAGE